MNPEVREYNIFPLYVLLARPVADAEVSGQNAAYLFSQSAMLKNFVEFSGKDHTEASFVIPEIKKLANDARLNNLTIIIFSKGIPNNVSDDNHSRIESEPTFSFSKLEGNCHWGKVQVDSFCLSLEKCVTLSLGHRADMLSPVKLQPSFLEPRFLGRNNCFLFRSPGSGVNSACQIQVSLSAQELGANETSPYDSFLYKDVPPHIIRLRAGNVMFNYKYYNNLLQKTEVTEDFTCPFCLAKCASFKGLRYHLISSHDLFNYEFWVTEEYQAVNVSVSTDNWRPELISEGTDPRLQTFFFCSGMKKCSRSKHHVQTGSHVHLHVPESGSPVAAPGSSHEECNNKENATYNLQRPLAHLRNASQKNGYNDGHFYKGKNFNSLLSENHLLMARNRSESFGSQNRHTTEYIEPLSSSPDTSGFCAATAQTSTSNDFAQQASGSNTSHQNTLQLAKMRKILDERADPRNRALLAKRQFYHSHRAQPMALEQVLSDQDSEDEIDDDIADLEDRRMLDDFVDVTKDEKQIMHLWNSFVRKQRVLADGHIPWACEAFSRLHGQDFVLSPVLLWCWRLFMIKLWNHSLLDARTLNNCNLILEQFKSGSSDPKES